jgi:hypothetical protein
LNDEEKQNNFAFAFFYFIMEQSEWKLVSHYSLKARGGG